MLVQSGSGRRRLRRGGSRRPRRGTPRRGPRGSRRSARITVGGSRPANAVDVVELVLALDGVEELVRTASATCRSRSAMRAGRECPAHELAQARVLGRVHHDHHRDVLYGSSVIISSTMPWLDTIGLGVEQAGEHVVVAAERVEVVLLVAVDGRLVAQPLPDRVRVGVDRRSRTGRSRGRWPSCPWLLLSADAPASRPGEVSAARHRRA